MALTIIVVVLFATVASAAVQPEPTGTERVLVSFQPGTPANAKAAAHASLGAKAVGRLGAIGVEVVEIPAGSDVNKALKSYLRNPNVAFAEHDGMASALVTPDDPYYVRQWAPAYVNTPAAWDLTVGSSAVTIAVLDTGVQLSHPDLAGRLSVGYDFINNDTDPSDDNGHGTGVAGIAAATGNNTTGVAGMDWNARILPVKVLDSTGYGSWSVIAQGIVYAADQGANIINMSLGGTASSTLQAAVTYAYERGCTLVAASGNSGAGYVQYPAAYPEVIAVGSAYRDVVSSFSNYGAEIEVVAPGDTIDTLAMGSSYGRMTGTSAAAPFVAGLASLVRAAAPALSAAEVRQAITSSARDLGAAGWDPYYGWGHINAQAALAAAGATTPPDPEPTEPEPTDPEPTEPEPTPEPEPQPPADITPPTVSIVSLANGATIVAGLITLRAEASDDIGVTRVAFYVDGKLLGSDPSAPYSMNWNAKKLLGTHTLTAVAYDAAGNSTVSAPVTITIVKK